MKKLLSILTAASFAAAIPSSVISCGSADKIDPAHVNEDKFTLAGANVYQAEPGNYQRFMIAQPKNADIKVGELTLTAILKNIKDNKVQHPRISSIEVSQDGWQIYVSFYDPVDLSKGDYDLSFQIKSINGKTDLPGVGSTTNVYKILSSGITIDSEYPTAQDNPEDPGGYVALVVSLKPTGKVQFSNTRNNDGSYDLLSKWNTFVVYLNDVKTKVVRAYKPYSDSTSILLRLDTKHRVVTHDKIKIIYTWPDTGQVVSTTVTDDFE